MALVQYPETFDFAWCGPDNFAAEAPAFSPTFCAALAVEALAPPPGIEEDLFPEGLAIRVDGLPASLGDEEMLEASLEQLGFDALLLRPAMICAGEASCSIVLTVNSFEAAATIADHFASCDWIGCEKVRVTALRLDVSYPDAEEAAGMRSSASEFVPGMLWCPKGSAAASTTASSSSGSEVDVCSEHEA